MKIRFQCRGAASAAVAALALLVSGAQAWGQTGSATPVSVPPPAALESAVAATAAPGGPVQAAAASGGAAIVAPATAGTGSAASQALDSPAPQATPGTGSAASQALNSPAPQALNDVGARISDEAIRADLLFIRTQMERAERLNDSGEPFSAYHYAKALHWLDFAQDEYQMKDRSGVIEQALAEGMKLIAAMERKQADISMDTPLIPASMRVREDLWAAAARLKGFQEGFKCAAGDTARLEVQLVWAGYVQREMGWRSAKPYLQAAERYYSDALAAAETCPRPASSADEAAKRAAEDAAIAKLAPAKQIEVLADRVHFAYDRANIAVATAPVLDRIASVLRANPAIAVTIEGHADERGSDQYNLRLSQRRADAVRAYLAAAGVDRGRMKTVAYGKSRPEVKAADIEGYAVNRRVVIVPSSTADLQLKPQLDDLQLEKQRRAK
jgi:outer membrane protein OmpA-like peptidoglycan-associated protein/predicted DNA-binding protein (MmcQ/YjbR family)